MRLSSRRIAASSAVVVLALGGLTACSGDDSPSSSSSSSDQQGTELTKENFASTITSAIQKAGTSTLTLKGSAGGQEISGEGAQELGAQSTDSKVQLTLDVLGQSLELRLIDQVVYLNLGPASKNKFAKIDLTDESNPLVQQFSGLAGQTDLASQVESFSKAITSVEKKGAAKKLDGVQAQPYAVTVDSSKLELPKGTDTSQLPKTVTYTFYVGPDDLPRELVTNTQGAEFTLGFSDWGDDVTIEAPDKADITELDPSQLGAPAA